METKGISKLFVIIASGLMTVGLAPAASISWSSAQNISADTDVSLNGTMVRAANLTPLLPNTGVGNSASFTNALNTDETVNSVTFVAQPRPGAVSGTNYVLANGDVFVANDTTATGPSTSANQFAGFGGPSSTPGGLPTNAPFDALKSVSYQRMLSTAYWNDGTNTVLNSSGYAILLNNLTIGLKYELQVWVNDSRLSNLGENNPNLFTTFASSGGNSIDLQHNVGNALGGIGQFAIGTFTADATNQMLTMTGGTAGPDVTGPNVTSLLNAYQLRAIAPASAPMFTNILLAGTNLILRGKNGPANGGYQILRTPDLTVPLTNWPGIGMQTFDVDGNFSFTNVIPAEADNFYRLRVVSSTPVSAPVITAQPQDLAISAGSDANFSVTATGTGPLTYFWYFNTNTLLDSSSSWTLSISNAQTNNSGKVSVIVSNSYGVAGSVFTTLKVTNATFPPRIITQPTNLVSAMVGQTVNLSITATGSAPLYFQWYHNTNTVLTGQTNTTLTLANVQLTNAGYYSVVITNFYGTTNSLFAVLTVSTNPTPELIGWASVAGLGTTTTTGGGNAIPILATDIAQLKSLAADGFPRVIQLSGTYITGNNPVEIANNKTLVGLGSNVIIQGGININSRSNIIVRNISIRGNAPFATTNIDGSGILPVDSMAVRASHHLWLDHLDVSDGPDGNLDLTVGTDYVTVSWCKFWYTTPTRAHRLSCLIGNGSTATTDTNKNNVTYHHNWFAQGVQERMPRILFGKCHVFDNYYNSTNNNYCVGVGSFASVLIENNYFQGVKDCYKFADSNHAYITATNNLFNGTSGVTDTGLGGISGPTVVPFINPPYAYTLDPAADVRGIVTAGAGPQ